MIQWMNKVLRLINYENISQDNAKMKVCHLLKPPNSFQLTDLTDAFKCSVQWFSKHDVLGTSQKYNVPGPISDVPNLKPWCGVPATFYGIFRGQFWCIAVEYINILALSPFTCITVVLKFKRIVRNQHGRCHYSCFTDEATEPWDMILM